jgi:hypothetical protein
MPTNPFYLSLKDWHDFYVMGGAAAATLLGLLFVALSLNADLILSGKKPQLKYIAEQAFRNYLSILLIAFLMIAPFNSNQVFGQTLMSGVTAATIFTLYRLFAVLRHNRLHSSEIQIQQRILPAMIAYGATWLCGAQISGLIQIDIAPVPFIAVAMLILLISATETAWDMLVRVAEVRHASPGEK